MRKVRLYPEANRFICMSCAEVLSGLSYDFCLELFNFGLFQFQTPEDKRVVAHRAISLSLRKNTYIIN